MKPSALVAYIFLSLIWGSTFIFVKWAAQDISPAQITLLRVLFGFIPVLGYALIRRTLHWSHLRHLHHFVVMSLLATALYYYAYAKGTAMLPSSIAGMLSGAIPLFTFLCAWLFLRSERVDARKAAGIGLGFLGVLLAAQPWRTGAINPEGVLYMALGSLSLGSSFVYARRFISPLGLPAVTLTTYQIGIALILLLAVTDLDGITMVFEDTLAWTGLIFGLGIFGTGAAYIAYYHILESLGAVAAASVTYIPPIIALLIGVLAAGEIIQTTDYLAMALILAGVAVLQLAGRPDGTRQRST